MATRNGHKNETHESQRGKDVQALHQIGRRFREQADAGVLVLGLREDQQRLLAEYLTKIGKIDYRYEGPTATALTPAQERELARQQREISDILSVVNGDGGRVSLIAPADVADIDKLKAAIATFVERKSAETSIAEGERDGYREAAFYADKKGRVRSYRDKAKVANRGNIGLGVLSGLLTVGLILTLALGGRKQTPPTTTPGDGYVEKGEYDKVVAERDGLQSDKTTLQSEKATLEENLKVVDAALKKLTDENAEMSEVVDELRVSIAEYIATNALLEKTNGELLVDLNKKIQELAALDQKIAAGENLNKKQDERIAELETQIGVLQAIIDQNKKENQNTAQQPGSNGSESGNTGAPVTDGTVEDDDSISQNGPGSGSHDDEDGLGL